MFDNTINDTDITQTTINGKYVQQLTNNDLKQMIIRHLFQTYNIRMNSTNKYFTAIDPKIDMENLCQNKHLVYINTNKKIQLIYLVQFNHQNICLLIDKQTETFYILQCQFSQSLYQGTIFEGETIDSYFMISDFLVYMNKNITVHALDKRITLLNSIISVKNYTYDNLLDPFEIIVKDFVEYKHLLSYVTEYLPKQPYYQYISGLIFRPIAHGNKNIIYNFNNQGSFQFSNNSGHSVPHDIPRTIPHTPSHNQQKINTNKYSEVKFLLFEMGNPDDYYLKLVNDDGQLVDYDSALVNDIRTSQYLQTLLSKKPDLVKTNGICVLCRYYPNFHKWKPINVCDNNIPDNINNLLN